MAADCIAHRGDSLKHPGNSLAAMRSAWESGADVAEVDMQLLKDGALVLFHDTEIGNVAVRNLDRQQLQALVPTHQVPTLEEALLATVSGKALLIDLKDESTVFLDRVIKQVQASTISGSRVMMQSTSLEALKYVRTKAPQGMELFYVSNLKTNGASPDPNALAASLKQASLQGITAQGRQFVDAAFVKAFHLQGLKYYVWTINEPDRMQHYVGLGVDGVITDDPVGFRKLGR